MNSGARLSACVAAFAAELDVVYRSLRRFGVGMADAEDLAQEVFLVMCRRWTDYNPARPLRPWLMGIAFRVARDHRKRPSRELAGGFIDILDESTDPDRRLAASRARALVREALGALPEKQRAVMVLHDLDGVAMQEIASALSAPITTLYSRLVTARRSFARAVRRLERSYAVVPVSLEWLLASERAPDPLPPAARGRVLARARAHVSAEKVAAPSPSPLAVRARALEFAAAGVIAAVAIGVLWQRPTADARAEARIGIAPEAAPAPARSFVIPRAPRLASLPAAASPAPPSLSQGLVGYWRFDDAAGGPGARDLSGHATDCQARGQEVDWTAGRFGGAVRLTGRGWLECPGPRFGGAPDLTVAAWIKRARRHRGMRVLAGRQLGSGARDHFFFGLINDDLAVSSHVWNGPLRRPLPPGLDRWVHVAAVHRDGQVALFIDGALVASRRSYRGRTVREQSPILIGAGVNGPDPAVTTQRFTGLIDELAVYDRPLSSDEVAALAAGQQPPLSR